MRETEALVKKAIEHAAGNRAARRGAAKKDVHTRAAEEQLESALGTRVRMISRKGKGGRIEIDFTNENELKRIYDALTGKYIRHVVS